jgi:hypothetical protein
MELMALAASFAINPSTQLQHLEDGTRLGSRAYMLATTLDELSTGLHVAD